MERPPISGERSKKFARTDQPCHLLSLCSDLLKIILRKIWTGERHPQLVRVCKRFKAIIIDYEFLSLTGVDFIPGIEVFALLAAKMIPRGILVNTLFRVQYAVQSVRGNYKPIQLPHTSFACLAHLFCVRFSDHTNMGFYNPAEEWITKIEVYFKFDLPTLVKTFRQITPWDFLIQTPNGWIMDFIKLENLHDYPEHMGQPLLDSLYPYLLKKNGNTGMIHHKLAKFFRRVYRSPVVESWVLKVLDEINQELKTNSHFDSGREQVFQDLLLSLLEDVEPKFDLMVTHLIISRESKNLNQAILDRLIELDQTPTKAIRDWFLKYCHQLKNSESYSHKVEFMRLKRHSSKPIPEVTLVLN